MIVTEEIERVPDISKIKPWITDVLLWQAYWSKIKHSTSNSAPHAKNILINEQANFWKNHMPLVSRAIVTAAQLTPYFLKVLDHNTDNLCEYLLTQKFWSTRIPSVTSNYLNLLQNIPYNYHFCKYLLKVSLW